MSAGNPNTTRCDAGTESRVVASLMGALTQCELFRIYHEVRGRYVSLHPAKVLQEARIDMVLVPRDERVVSVGWGPIGIEAKGGDVKLGPAIAQALDYHGCEWEIRPNWWLRLDWIFLSPAAEQLRFGPISSVCAQNRVGVVDVGDDGLYFEVGQIKVICPGRDVFKHPTSGSKSGSRGTRR